MQEEGKVCIGAGLHPTKARFKQPASDREGETNVALLVLAGLFICDVQEGKEDGLAASTLNLLTKTLDHGSKLSRISRLVLPRPFAQSREAVVDVTRLAEIPVELLLASWMQGAHS